MPLVKIDEQKDICLEVLDKLEEAYQKSGDKQNVLRIGDESDKITDQVDVETHALRQFLLSLVNKSVHLKNNVAMATESQPTNTQQPAQEIITTENMETPLLENDGVQTESNSSLPQETPQVNSNFRHEQLSSGNNTTFVDNEIGTQSSGSSSNQSELNTTSQSGSARKVDGHLQRIRIPIFAGDKMKFQQWNAAFTSCVDKTSMSPQFKMLRLESCLRGEAADTVRGLGYSQEAYNAARARLERKYGGSRRQVQSHLE